MERENIILLKANVYKEINKTFQEQGNYLLFP
jgi:hypothetical protein